MIREIKIKIISWVGVLIFGFGLLIYLLVRPNYETRLIKDIKQNPAIYKEIIELIKMNDFANMSDKLINVNKLPKILIDKLSETKIKHNLTYLVISKLNDCNNIKVEFMIDRLHLEYYSCPDSTFPKPDSHSKVGFVETFGINENWCIWIDNDYI